MAHKPLISLIIPSYNEADGLKHLYQAVTKVTDALPYRFELVFIDDGSTDGSRAVLAELAAADDRVRPLELARNFGKEIAITAGLNEATGDAAIMLDADLQHPPSYIPEFLKRWEAGAEVVVGVRQASRQHAGALKRGSSVVFYRFINIISDQVVMRGATDYRLIDRLVIDEFNRFTERGRLTRGLIDWLGFSRDFVPFEPAHRLTGSPAYTWRKLLGLAMHSIISLSFFPLKLAGYLGLIIITLSLPMGAFMFTTKYVLGDPMGYNFSGPAQLAVIVVFLVGVVLACLGLMSLYIAAIYAEVTNRPLYVLRRARRHHPERDA